MDYRKGNPIFSSLRNQRRICLSVYDAFADVAEMSQNAIMSTDQEPEGFG